MGAGCEKMTTNDLEVLGLEFKKIVGCREYILTTTDSRLEIDLGIHEWMFSGVYLNMVFNFCEERGLCYCVMQDKIVIVTRLITGGLK